MVRDSVSKRDSDWLRAETIIHDRGRWRTTLVDLSRFEFEDVQKRNWWCLLVLARLTVVEEAFRAKVLIQRCEDNMLQVETSSGKSKRRLIKAEKCAKLHFHNACLSNKQSNSSKLLKGHSSY